MWPSLEHERVDGFDSYSVFNEYNCHGSAPAEYERRGTKTDALQMGPKIYNSDFLENGCKGFDQISVFHGAYLRT
jgi:hypothetical protein